MTVDPIVLLYPGAGTDASHPSLLAIEAALDGVECHRLDFAYRRAGRRAPDRAPKLMAEVRAHLAELAADASPAGERRPVVLAGRSMGGRIASMVAAGADGEPPPPEVIGVALVAYPLHPPGRPDRLRVEHLPELTVPCLFVSGTRDPFGTPDELTGWTSTVTGPVTHVWIEGARHELRNADDEVAAHVADFVRTLTHP